MIDLVYTELDDLAYKLLCLDCDKKNLDYIGKPFFVNHKRNLVYIPFYNKAKILLRKDKINKICLRSGIK